jgi:protein TonB
VRPATPLPRSTAPTPLTPRPVRAVGADSRAAAALAAVPAHAPEQHPRPRAKLSPAGALPPARIPPEALASPRGGSLVVWAIALSLLVHTGVLIVRFVPFDLSRSEDKAPPLEVALVNAKSKTAPTKADVLAQANLDGGGNTDANRRAKSPLPVLAKDSQQNQITLATERVKALEQQTKELLTQLKSNPIAPPQPAPSPDAPPPTNIPTADQLMANTAEAMRLEAQIDKEMDAYQKRPKRRFVGARAQEYRFARYVEDWRLKIERVGNLNYPAAARDLKLYGSLIITVSIRADGSLENVEVNRSSGQRILDAAAVKIVEMAAPYAAFPPDIRRDTDILNITRTWTFTKGDELVSK